MYRSTESNRLRHVDQHAIAQIAGVAHERVEPAERAIAFAPSPGPDPDRHRRCCTALPPAGRSGRRPIARPRFRSLTTTLAPRTESPHETADAAPGRYNQRGSPSQTHMISCYAKWDRCAAVSQVRVPHQAEIGRSERRARSGGGWSEGPATDRLRHTWIRAAVSSRTPGPWPARSIRHDHRAVVWHDGMFCAERGDESSGASVRSPSSS